VALDRIQGRELTAVAVRGESPTSDSGTNPLLERARRGVDAAEAAVAEERAGRLPRVEAVGGVLDYGAFADGHRAEWQGGLRLSWPVFTGGQRTAAIRRASAERTAAESELSATELRLAYEVDTARTAIAEADARADALGLAVIQWSEVARIERLALGAGSGVQRDLLRAEAGLFQARAGLEYARHEAILARVALARATGTLDSTWLERALEGRR
jgi:outer membrane protein